MNIGHLEKRLSGGKTNSLGDADEVIRMVLNDRSLLEELYGCMFSADAWVRMRAADSFEKICRQHPEWIEPFVDKIQTELSDKDQPSIRWHIAQIYEQVVLTNEQKRRAVVWLADLLASPHGDWIVMANAMHALACFTKSGDFKEAELHRLLTVQLHHTSNAVRKKAQKLIDNFA